MEQNRKVPRAKAEQWCRENGNIPYYECSAKENISVEEAFTEVAKVAVRKEAS